MLQLYGDFEATPKYTAHGCLQCLLQLLPSRLAPGCLIVRKAPTRKEPPLTRPTTKLLTTQLGRNSETSAKFETLCGFRQLQPTQVECQNSIFSLSPSMRAPTPHINLCGVNRVNNRSPRKRNIPLYDLQPRLNNRVKARVLSPPSETHWLSRWLKSVPVRISSSRCGWQSVSPATPGSHLRSGSGERQFMERLRRNGGTHCGYPTARSQF